MPTALCPSAQILVDRFVAGQSKPFVDLVENREEFMKADLYSSVSMLNHDACHDLSIALAEASNHDSILLFTDDVGLPIHSALFSKEKSLILDGNGINKVKEALKHWKHIAGATRTRAIAIEDLAMFSDPSEDQVDYVISEFNKIADFISEHGLDRDAKSDHESSLDPMG